MEAHQNKDRKFPSERHGLKLRSHSTRCRSCGFRVRGKDHAEGDHHKGRKPRHAAHN